MREQLPQRRGSETFSFEGESGLIYSVTTSRFSDGRLAEIFINSAKAGSQADVNARDAAIVASIAFQHGVPVETIRSSLSREGDGRASSPLGRALDILAEEGAAPDSGLHGFRRWRLVEDYR